MPNISYNDLYFLYENDCKLRNISSITIKGYEFTHKKFKEFAGDNLECEYITQDLINEYILHLKDNLKPQTMNSYMFKISHVIKFGIRREYIKDTIELTHLVEPEHFKEIYTTKELEILLKKPRAIQIPTSLHLFRDTFITLSVRKGISPLFLKRITGHSNLKTLNKYYNFDINDLVNIVDEYNPLEDFRAKRKKLTTK